MNVIMLDSPMRIGFVYSALSYFWSYLFCLVPPFYFLCFSVTGREEEGYFGSASDVGVVSLK